MSSIDDFDLVQLIGGLPEDQQKKVKIALLKALKDVYVNLDGFEDGEFASNTEDESFPSLGKLLEEKRNKKNWNVYRAAKVAGIRPEQVKAVEDGKNYTSKILFKYLDALGVRILIE